MTKDLRLYQTEQILLEYPPEKNCCDELATSSARIQAGFVRCICIHTFESATDPIIPNYVIV